MAGRSSNEGNHSEVVSPDGGCAAVCKSRERKRSIRGHGRSVLVDVTGIITAVVVGLIIGFLGRLVAPGRQSIQHWLTLVVGVVAALIGTSLASVVPGGRYAWHRLGRVDLFRWGLRPLGCQLWLACLAGGTLTADGWQRPRGRRPAAEVNTRRRGCLPVGHMQRRDPHPGLTSRSVHPTDRPDRRDDRSVDFDYPSGLVHQGRCLGRGRRTQHRWGSPASSLARPIWLSLALETRG